MTKFINNLGEEHDQSTSLAGQDMKGLLQPLSNRDQLNREEYENIAKARIWALKPKKRRSSEQVLNEIWIKELHQRMFGDVWSWAGKYRTDDKNIGVPFLQIQQDLLNTIANSRAQIQGGCATRDKADGIAIRLSHAVVKIHPFPNGNGRWSRLLADVLIEALGGQTFSWSGLQITENPDCRPQYIRALQIADFEYNYHELIQFARS